MIKYEKDDFDGTIEDIMNSVNELLNNTGDGFETEDSEESEMLKRRKSRTEDGKNKNSEV